MDDSLYFNEQHLAVRDMVSAFARDEVAPVASQHDEASTFPWENVKKMGELGLLGIPWPEEIGGAGFDTISFMIAIEELAKVCASHSITISAHTTLGTSPIVNFGTKAQIERYVPLLASGRKLLAQKVGHAKQDGRVGIVAAGVHDARVLGGEGHGRLLHNRQGIHVGANGQHRAIGTADFGHHPCAADLGADIGVADFGQRVGHERGRAEFAEPQFGVLVYLSPQTRHLTRKGMGLGKEGHGEVIGYSLFVIRHLSLVIGSHEPASFLCSLLIAH